MLDRLLVHCLAQLEQLEGLEAPPAGLETEIARDNALYYCSIEHALSTNQIELGLELVLQAVPGVAQSEPTVDTRSLDERTCRPD